MKSPLALKIALSFVVTICLTMGSYTYFNIKYIANEMKSDAQKETKEVFLSTLPIINENLANPDPQSLHIALVQTLRNPIIKAAAVFQADGTLFDFVQRKGKHSSRHETLLTGVLYKLENKQKIVNGYFIMEYSIEHITHTIYKEISKTVFLALCLSVAALLLCFFYLRRFVLVPYIAQQKEQQRMTDELETARIVQQSLLPKARNLRVGAYEISGCCKSASECNGDWWHFYPLNNDRVLLMLGDVTGHGTPSALLAAVVKGYCDSIGTRHEMAPAEILAELDYVVQKSSPEHLFMTMFVAVLDPVHKTICYANAAQNFPYIIRNDREAILSPLTVTGKSLGAKWNENAYAYKMKTENFSPGDILFLYTDGFLAARDKIDARFYNTRQLEKTFVSVYTEDTAKIIGRLMDELKKNQSGKTISVEFDDDITLVACRYIKDVI